METIFSLAAGVALSATCGFRVFVPLLVMNLAAKNGYLTLSDRFEWIGGGPALIVFAIATVVEILAYYIPWLDNVLDTIATPAAFVAGTVVTASFIGDMSPFLMWVLAAIAGGGAAAAVQGSTVLLRGSSSATTGGVGNPVLSTGELIVAGAGSVLAVAAPIACLILMAIAAVLVYRRYGGRRRRNLSG